MLLIGVCLMFEKRSWHSDNQLHSNMELAATLVAAIVGVLALVRYYARSRVSYFFIGTGFLGAALLDGFHLVVTQQSMIALLPSEPARLIAWSWFFSRTFLAGWLVLSLVMWKLEDPLEPGKVHLFKGIELSETLTISLAITVVTIMAMGLILVPTPQCYFPNLPLGRPQELIPAMLFLIAGVGYYYKGLWRADPFESSILFSILIALVAQALVMTRSFALHDYNFDLAHLLKITSYIAVFVGLTRNMYFLYSNVIRSSEEILESQRQLEIEKRRAEESMQAKGT